jgi:phosphoserine phosphatase RsbU/P
MAARCRHAIASAASEHESPSAVLAAAQSALQGALPDGKFATVVACRYLPDGRLEGALAGHHRPLALGPAAEMTELELPYNPPIVQGAKSAFGSGSTRLRPNQTLLLYTDGITESRRDGRFFGLEGIAAQWRLSEDSSPADFTADLCRASGEFHQAGLAADDRLALAARAK